MSTLLGPRTGRLRYRILDVLEQASVPLSPFTVTMRTGARDNTIRKTLSRMARDGQIQRVGYGTYAPLERTQRKE